jgi:hypothetical protein
VIKKTTNTLFQALGGWFADFMCRTVYSTLAGNGIEPK